MIGFGHEYQFYLPTPLASDTKAMARLKNSLNGSVMQLSSAPLVYEYGVITPQGIELKTADRNRLTITTRAVNDTIKDPKRVLNVMYNWLSQELSQRHSEPWFSSGLRLMRFLKAQKDRLMLGNDRLAAPQILISHRLNEVIFKMHCKTSRYEVAVQAKDIEQEGSLCRWVNPDHPSEVVTNEDLVCNAYEIETPASRLSTIVGPTEKRLVVLA